MRVGAFNVDPVYDGYGDQVARDILHVPGEPDAWDKCGRYVDDAGNIRLICGGYLLRAGDRVVLIDAGLGEYEDEQWHGGQFLNSLRGLGVTPAEVTDVVFTHLHWDHFGWATRKGEIVFTNATYAPRPRPHARVDDLRGIERQRAPPADRGRAAHAGRGDRPRLGSRDGRGQHRGETSPR
jgi:glyoxylase-like metal-dependent hydrolase (beta-lactamase superfamily II)